MRTDHHRRHIGRASPVSKGNEDPLIPRHGKPGIDLDDGIRNLLLSVFRRFRRGSRIRTTLPQKHEEQDEWPSFGHGRIICMGKPTRQASLDLLCAPRPVATPRLLRDEPDDLGDARRSKSGVPSILTTISETPMAKGFAEKTRIQKPPIKAPPLD